MRTLRFVITLTILPAGFALQASCYLVSMQMRRTASCASLALACLFLSACTPLTVSFELFGREKKLTETVVDEDDRAVWKVAVIDIDGLIYDANLPALLAKGGNPADEIVARLNMAADDPGVKAVILRVNSPGGSVTGSDVVYSEIMRFKEKTGKPVVVSMSEVAASGGYYVSLAGDKIIAYPTTITGSIGVIIPTINFSNGLNRIGIVARSVKSGPNKDLANSLEPMRESQYAILQNLVDEFYANFKAKVKERRPNADMTRFDQATDGRIFSGREGVSLGLVDSLGGIHDAFDEAKILANIPSAKMVKYRPEGAIRPRSPYASANEPMVAPQMTQPGGTSGGTEINLLQINAQGLYPASGPAPSAVYYLWLAGEP